MMTYFITTISIKQNIRNQISRPSLSHNSITPKYNKGPKILLTFRFYCDIIKVSEVKAKRRVITDNHIKVNEKIRTKRMKG